MDCFGRLGEQRLEDIESAAPAQLCRLDDAGKDGDVLRSRCAACPEVAVGTRVKGTDNLNVFATGIFPDVQWSEYWYQAEQPLPPGAGQARKVMMLHATQTDDDGELLNEWFGTVTFVIEPEKEISDTPPVVEGLTGVAASWVEARPNGTFVVKPPAQRGKNNQVHLVPLEYEFVELLEF